MKYQILFKRMLGVGLMLALLTGCTASAMPAPTPMPPTSTSIPPGLAPTPTTNILIQTLMIGDYQYVMECNGEGSPAVLLFGGRAANWKPILTEIKVSTRTCLFEHAGSRSTPLTAEEIAKNVHVLLNEAEITGPYVVVGFSVGGYIARVFTDLYPEEVVGTALLDASHEDQNARFLATLPPESSGDCQELKDYRTELQGHNFLPIGPEITLDFDASATEVREIGTGLGNLPLVVLTAGRSEWPDCFPQEVRQQLDQAWLEMQNDLANLSTNSTHLLAEESGHSFAEQPEMVIDAIRRAVQAAQTGVTDTVP